MALSLALTLALVLALALALALAHIYERIKIFEVDRSLNIQSPPPLCCTLSTELLLLLENTIKTKEYVVWYIFIIAIDIDKFCF